MKYSLVPNKRFKRFRAQTGASERICSKFACTGDEQQRIHFRNTKSVCVPNSTKLFICRGIGVGGRKRQCAGTETCSITDSIDSLSTDKIENSLFRPETVRTPVMSKGRICR